MAKIKKSEDMGEHQKAIEDYTNTLKRLQADFENYIKRVEKEKEEFVNYSNHKLITKLLVIADDLDKALDVVKDKEVANGLEMIHKQFHKVLQEEGVLQINAVGAKLDPYMHEVIDIVSGNEDDLIIDEIQRGYIIKDKVLRPSKVRVSKTGGKNV
mgnify:CR=1 FL=1